MIEVINMVEKLETLYMTIYRQINTIEVPLSFRRPSANIFVDRRSMTNDMMTAFGELNKLRAALSLPQIEYEKFIESVRSAKTTQDDLPIIMMKAGKIFQKGKGQCMETIRKKMESIE